MPTTTRRRQNLRKFYLAYNRHQKRHDLLTDRTQRDASRLDTCVATKASSSWQRRITTKGWNCLEFGRGVFVMFLKIGKVVKSSLQQNLNGVFYLGRLIVSSDNLLSLSTNNTSLLHNKMYNLQTKSLKNIIQNIRYFTCAALSSC